MNILAHLQNSGSGKFQIRKTQMSERSTLVDNKAPGGLTFVNKGIKLVDECTGIPAGKLKTCKLY